MSLITKALKKTQESRQNIIYLTDAPKSWLKTAVMATLAVGMITAIILSTEAINLAVKNSASKQTQELALQKVIKNQEKRINDLITVINKDKKSSTSQMRALDNNLTLADNDHYRSLKEAIIDDKQEIAFLEKETRALNQKIEGR